MHYPLHPSPGFRLYVRRIGHRQASSVPQAFAPTQRRQLYAIWSARDFPECLTERSANVSIERVENGLNLRLGATVECSSRPELVLEQTLTDRV